jgi:hypothetical protein
MRRLFLAAIALGAVGCGRGPSGALSEVQGNLPGSAICERRSTRIVPFTAPDAADVIETRAVGSDCESAVVVWTIRTAAGKPLWTYAAPYEALATAQDLTNVPAMDAFLSRWAGGAVDDTGASPHWPVEQADPPEAWGPTGRSQFTRSTYEAIREDRLPRICLALTVERTACIFYDDRADATDIHFEQGS